jgi:hypothetical protein
VILFFSFGIDSIDASIARSLPESILLVKISSGKLSIPIPILDMGLVIS